MGAPEEAATALLYMWELNSYHRFWKASSSCTAPFFNNLVALNRKIPPAITCLSKANLVCPMAQNSCLDSSVIVPYKTCAVWNRGNLMKALAAWTIMVLSASIVWPYWLSPLRYSWADSFVSGRRSTLALWEKVGSTWERSLVHRVPLIKPRQSPSNWLNSQPALPSLHFLCSFESEWKIRTSSGVVMTLRYLSVRRNDSYSLNYLTFRELTPTKFDTQVRTFATLDFFAFPWGISRWSVHLATSIGGPREAFLLRVWQDEWSSKGPNGISHVQNAIVDFLHQWKPPFLEPQSQSVKEHCQR